MVCRTDWFVDEFHGNESLLLLVIHISNNLRDHRNCMQMPTTRTDFVFLWRGGEGVVVVVVVVVVFIILLGESQQTGLLLGTLGGFLYYGQRERAMLLDDSRMEAHSTDLPPEKK